MTAAKPPEPFYHDIAWTDHKKPRWMIATCRKCKREWTVHATDSLDWRPKSSDGCPVPTAVGAKK